MAPKGKAHSKVQSKAKAKAKATAQSKAKAKAKASAQAKGLRLTFKFPNGSEMAQDNFALTDRIKDVLAKIYCERSLLEYENTLLKHGKTLAYYSIEAGATLLVLAVSPSTPRAWLGEGMAHGAHSVNVG